MGSLRPFSGFFLILLFRATFGQIPLQLDPQRGVSISDLVRPHSLTSNHDPISPLYRLNGTFTPTNYELELLVLLDEDSSEYGEQFTVPGKVYIDLTPNEVTNQITLHAFLLNIDASSIVVSNVAQPDQLIQVTGTRNETENVVQFYTILLERELEVGVEYEIYMEFIAPISSGITNGLFLSTYVDPESGDTKRVAATQMESIHARKLFPCFDEPELKATFDVSIIRKANYSSLANANLISSTADPLHPGYVIDKYNKTVIMSTYLFAMVVSDFTFAEADLPTFGGKPVRTYAPPHMIAQGGGNYSAQVAAELLQFYDDYFQAPYPFTKMDSAAVPNFGPGAMENYGLNLYRESLLIFYPGETLESSRNSITSVLAHELGHQNFGNWVSLNWWTQIWLNEGFATYVANLGVDAVRPEFRAREGTIGQLQNSMVADVAPNSHPLQNNVPPTEPDSHVGTITYDKGASINRMTEKFLTEETFQKGLRYYLQDMQFQAAHSDDLFRNLDWAATEDDRLPEGVAVKDILDTWTLQRGHPLVRVKVAGVNSINITQEKYAHLDDNPGKFWYVPVTMVTQDRPTLPNNIPEFWMSPSQELANIDHDTSKWMMINQDATGYYRVLYDDQLTSLIRDQLEANASVISPLSRSQLLDDYFTMAFRDVISVETALNLTTYLAQEDHFTVWDVVFNHLRRTYNLFEHSDSCPYLRAYLLPRLEQALVAAGIEQSPEHIGIAAIYRAKLLDWACAMEFPACFEYAQKLFAQWQDTPTTTPINIDVQSVLHCAIVASGGQAAYDFTFQQYLELSGNAPLKSRLLNALGCTTDETLLQDLLEKAVNTTSGLARSDATTAIQRVALNRAGKEAVFSLLENRLPEIIREVGGGSVNPVANIVGSLAASLSSTDDMSRLSTFIMDNSAVLAPIADALQNSVNNIFQNFNWFAKYGVNILAWLQSM